MSTIYLLHLDKPLRHASGQGARMLAVCVERGITWQLVRTWEGGRKFERQLKNRKDAPRLCPICNGASALKLAKEN